MASRCPSRHAGGVRIAVATDEATPTTEALRAHLSVAGHEVVDTVADGSPWPEVGRSVADAVASGEADRGVVCCWTGTGVSMAASQVPGVRAALCGDAETARGARRWNDANVLAVSLRLTTPAVARELVDAFLTTDVDPDEVATIAQLD